MNKFSLNGQIAALRKKSGMTQEELATALGVTNQAVSKWESAVCCPDIQLLPDIAELFGVSIDELIGCRTANRKTSEESEMSADALLGQVRAFVEKLTREEAENFALRLAYLLHVLLVSGEMTESGAGNRGWNTDSALEHAQKGEWGVSQLCYDNFTTKMRAGTVLFSDNKCEFRCSDRVREISTAAKLFSDKTTLSILLALYELTAKAESDYAGVDSIAAECGLSADIVSDCLASGLGSYLTEKQVGGAAGFRIQGRFMHIPPLLALLGNM